jgi:hypothetical protein
MQVETCQIGGALRLGEGTRIVFHRRQGARIVLGATAPAGVNLTLDGAQIRPISGTVGVWSYLFSLQALRRFSLGPFELHVWLPGEIVPHAADCENWVHIGVLRLPEDEGSRVPSGVDRARPRPLVPDSTPLRLDISGLRHLTAGA